MMTISDPLSELSTITGMAPQNLMFFSKSTGLSYAMIRAWYMTNGRMPTLAEVSVIKIKSS